MLRLRERHKRYEDYVNHMPLMTQNEETSAVLELLQTDEAVLRLEERLRREQEERLLKRAIRGKKKEEPYVT